MEAGITVAGARWGALLSDSVREQKMSQEIRSIHTAEGKFNTNCPSSQAFFLNPLLELIGLIKGGVVILRSRAVRHEEWCDV